MAHEPHDSIDGVLYDVEAGVMDIPDARNEIIEHIKKHYTDIVGPVVRDLTAVPPEKPKSLVRDIITKWINTL